MAGREVRAGRAFVEIVLRDRLAGGFACKLVHIDEDPVSEMMDSASEDSSVAAVATVGRACQRLESHSSDRTAVVRRRPRGRVRRRLESVKPACDLSAGLEIQRMGCDKYSGRKKCSWATGRQAVKFQRPAREPAASIYWLRLRNPLGQDADGRRNTARSSACHRRW